MVVLGGGGEDRQAFSVESHFPVVSSSCVFQVLSLQMRVFFSRRGKGFKYKHMWHLSNVTVSIPDT